MNTRTNSHAVKSILLCGLIVFIGNSLAECESVFDLKGSISIESCDEDKETCIPAIEALSDNIANIKDDETDISMVLFTSPWRFYDAEMRIMTIAEVAEQIKPLITKETKTVSLIGSWAGVAPKSGTKSLAQKLSDLLKNVSVRAPNGFLWIDKDGKLSITHQAFTVRRGGAYKVAKGGNVMISLVAGWYALSERVFIEDQIAEGIMRAGAGWDIFSLCPYRALKSFETAAKLNHPIAAYNAALMRLERNEKEDFEAAKKLLSLAAKLGDKKAINKLERLD